MVYNLAEEEQYLASYLESVSIETQQHAISNRLNCCEASRSLYCPECYQTLVPKRFWPGKVSSFPFQSIDIILGIKERRTSSTGIQLMCMCRMFAKAESDSQRNLKKEQSSEREGSSDNSNESWWRNAKLYDLNREDVLPSYETAAPGGDGTTFVLFPSKGKSVPISSVVHQIKRLIVLDIKWTRSDNVKLFSDQHKLIHKSNNKSSEKYNPLAPLNSLPFVHLEFPPCQSHYWRWHNRGEGMLSTIEALYFASREMSVALGGKHNNKEDLIDILWLFALQRSIIQNRCKQEGRLAAFVEEEKAHARALRNPQKRRKLKKTEN